MIIDVGGKMARILYGVCGEGMGHAIRSAIIVKELLKKHKVVIVSSNGAFDYLKGHFKSVHDIHGLHIVCRDNGVSNIITALQNIQRLPKGTRYSMRKIFSIIKAFKPNIIITDFEPFTSLASKISGIPSISIDNQHIITNCRISIPKRHIKDFMTAALIVKLTVNMAKVYLITTFFYPKTKHKRNYLFPPLLRDAILNAKPKEKDCILVYQTYATCESLIPILRRVNKKFLVYYLNRHLQEGNIIYRKFNETTFIKDLASCKAVITNGGFGLISEAVHLGKPVLSVPIHNHFEQITNAIYIEKLGYGEFHRHLTKDILENFISKIPEYKNNLKKYKREDNSRLFRKLEDLIKRLAKSSN